MIREQETGRLRASFRAVLPFLVGLGFLLLIGQLFTVIEEAITTGSTVGTLLPLFAMVAQYIVALGVVVWIASRLDHRPVTGFGLDIDGQWLRNLIAGFIIGTLALVTSILYATVRGVVTFETTAAPSGSSALTFLGVMVLVFLAVFFVQNVYEEVVFRGVMLQNFAEGLTMREVAIRRALILATAGSCVFFGIAHLQRGLIVAIDAMVVGVIFSLAYLLTGSLGLAIGVHFSRFPLELIFDSDAPGGELGLPVIEFTANAPDVELIRLGLTAGLLLLWVKVVYGDVRIAETVYQPTHE